MEPPPPHQCFHFVTRQYLLHGPHDPHTPSLAPEVLPLAVFLSFLPKLFEMSPERCAHTTLLAGKVHGFGSVANSSSFQALPELQINYFQVLLFPDQLGPAGLSRETRRTDWWEDRPSLDREKFRDEFLLSLTRLKCRYTPNTLLEFVTANSKLLPLEETLAVCLEAGATEGAEFLLEKAGDFSHANDLRVESFERLLANLVEADEAVGRECSGLKNRNALFGGFCQGATSSSAASLDHHAGLQVPRNENHDKKVVDHVGGPGGPAAATLAGGAAGPVDLLDLEVPQQAANSTPSESEGAVLPTTAPLVDQVSRISPEQINERIRTALQPHLAKLAEFLRQAVDYAGRTTALMTASEAERLWTGVFDAVLAVVANCAVRRGTTRTDDEEQAFAQERPGISATLEPELRALLRKITQIGLLEFVEHGVVLRALMQRRKNARLSGVGGGKSSSKIFPTVEESTSSKPPIVPAGTSDLIDLDFPPLDDRARPSTTTRNSPTTIPQNFLHSMMSPRSAAIDRALQEPLDLLVAAMDFQRSLTVTSVSVASLDVVHTLTRYVQHQRRAVFVDPSSHKALEDKTNSGVIRLPPAGTGSRGLGGTSGGGN